MVALAASNRSKKRARTGGQGRAHDQLQRTENSKHQGAKRGSFGQQWHMGGAAARAGIAKDSSRQNKQRGKVAQG